MRKTTEIRIHNMRRAKFNGESDAKMTEIVGLTRSDAIELDLALYIGVMCPLNHVAVDVDGNNTLGSVRYKSGSGCVRCNKENSSKQHIKNGKADSNATLETRSRIEDIKLARELGISVDDL